MMLLPSEKHGFVQGTKPEAPCKPNAFNQNTKLVVVASTLTCRNVSLGKQFAPSAMHT